MDLDQLRYFLRVAELRNFTRAANALHMSQPALSRSIQRLEDELGRPLFERRSRSVALTDAGTRFQAAARQITVTLDEVKAELIDDAERGRIRLGAIPTIAPFFLPGLLREFARDYPGASLLVQEDTTDNLIHRCKQGEIDLALLALPISVRYLDVEPLFDEELLLVVAHDHPLAGKRRIGIRDIKQHAFVLLDEAHCLSGNVVAFCQQRAFQPIAVERTSQIATVQELVALSHGVSMIPEMARRLDSSKRRVYRSLSGVTPKRTIAALSNPYRYQSRLLGAFRAGLRDYARGFETRGHRRPPIGRDRN